MSAAIERFAAPASCVIVAPEAVKIEAVSKVSTFRKLGVVARVAGQRAGRNRTFNAVMTGVRTTARSFGRAAAGRRRIFPSHFARDPGAAGSPQWLCCF